MVDREKLQNFEQLEVWQRAQDLAVDVYKLVKQFPSEEKFGMTSQMQRAVSSISANIAEGFGRQSPKDKLHFYAIAYGSLLETKNFTYLARRLDYLSSEDEQTIIESINVNQRLLNGLMAAIRSRL